MPGEEWKDVVGYEGLYMVSDYGRVKSLDRVIKGELHHGKLLKAIFYQHTILFSLNKDSKCIHVRCHKMVAVAFCDNPSNLPYLIYKDGNWLNNCSTNICWSDVRRKPIHNRETFERRKKPIYGVGINDIKEYLRGHKVYLVWKSILARCYSDLFHKDNKTYVNCEICEEWKYLSVFKKWFDENYQEGYQLDKDLLCYGSKIYSPNTCCFIPQDLNNLIKQTCKSSIGMPKGVYRQYNLFYAEFRHGGYRNRKKFDNPHDAAVSYAKMRAEYVIGIAETYYRKGEINERIFDAVKQYFDYEIQQAKAA